MLNLHGRIVLELKDKLKAETAVNANTEKELKQQIEKDTKMEDSISALQVLGYNRKEIEKIFEKLNISEYTVEELIKKGLQLLGRV